MALSAHIIAGTPQRLDADCPDCGWADLWQVALHTLSDTGVNTIGTHTQCMRCAARKRET